MVYKIRNKGFDIFAPATNPRVFTARKTLQNIDLGRYISLSIHMTRYSNMRYLHNYRRISRAWKQFLMGDRIAEQIAILNLREQFLMPTKYKSPIENNWYLPRTIADIWDRHYALFAHNQHPLQLHSYQDYNTFLKGLNDDGYHQRLLGIVDKVKAIKRQREQALDLDEGETLSIDDIADIYIDVMAQFREENGFQGKARDKKGEFKDYLEVRRPFGAAQ